MKRESRNLQHEKGGRIREVSYPPINSDGQNGDARIYEEDLYVKTKGRWVKIMSGDKIINQELTRNIDLIISEGVVQHTSLSGITANQHHYQSHAIDGSDHTGYLTVAKGGTGLETVATDSLLTGNGTGALTAEALLAYTSTGLGIGTAEPQSNLHIQAATDTEAKLYLSCGSIESGAGTELGGIYFGASENGGWTGASIKGLAAEDYNSGEWGTDLVFYATPIDSDTQTPRMTILNSGNVGIGTTAPASNLEIKSATSADCVLKINTTDAGNSTSDATIQLCENDVVKWQIYNDGSDSDKLEIHDDGSVRMVITQTGYVGIGTSDPTAILQVSKAEATVYDGTVPSVGDCMLSLVNLNVAETQYDHATLQFNVNGGTHNRIGTISLVAEDAGTKEAALTFCTNEDGTTRAEKMRISSAGNVGIGTAAPAQLLHVEGASGLDGATPVTLRIHSSSAGTWTDEAITSQIEFGTTDATGAGGGGVKSAIKCYADDTSGADLGLSFWTTTDGTSIAEQMRIDSAGYVGIGTASPGAMLHVGDGTIASSGRILIDAVGNSTDSAILQLEDGDNAKRWDLCNSDRSSFPNDFELRSYDGSSTYRMPFRVATDAPTTSMRITSTGVGIGTSSPGENLTVAGEDPGIWIQHDAVNEDASGHLDFTENENTFGTSNGYGFRILHDGDNEPDDNTGLLRFQSGQSTTVTDRLVIERDTGNVGIGTTGPDKALEINDAGGACLRLTYGDNDGGASNKTDFAVSSSGDLTIDPSGDDIFIGGGAKIGTSDFASRTTGWRITDPGDADFRYLYTTELHAAVFIADLEQALAGGQIIAKSVATLAADYALPAAGGNSTFVAHDLPSAAGMAVFGEHDWIRFRSFNRDSMNFPIAQQMYLDDLDGAGGLQAFISDTQNTTYNGSWMMGKINGAGQNPKDYGYHAWDASDSNSYPSVPSSDLFTVYPYQCVCFAVYKWDKDGGSFASYITDLDVGSVIKLTVTGSSQDADLRAHPFYYRVTQVPFKAVDIGGTGALSTLSNDVYQIPVELLANLSNPSQVALSSSAGTAYRVNLDLGDGSTGELIIGDAWGQVTGYQASTPASGQQTWTFTRPTDDFDGSAYSTITADSIILDYGRSGNGFHEVNAIDGSGGNNSPYSQIVTWEGDNGPGESGVQTVRTRLGNLSGIGIGSDDEWGLFAGASETRYIKASSDGVEIKSTATQYTTYTGSAIEFYDTDPADASAAVKKLDIGAGDIKMYDDSGNIVSHWNSGVLQLGANLTSATDVDAINISSSGVKIYGSANTNFVEIDGTAVTVQSSANDKIAIDSSGIVLTEGGNDRVTMASNGVTVGKSGEGRVVITDTEVALWDGQGTPRKRIILDSAGIIALGGTTGANVSASSENDCIRMTPAGGVKIFDNSQEYVHVHATGMDVYHNNYKAAIFGATTVIGSGTVVATDSTADCIRIASGTISIFESDNNKATITSSGLTCYQGGTDMANFGSTMRVGVNAADKTAFRVAADGTASIGTSGTKKITMDTAGVLTVTDIKLSGPIVYTTPAQNVMLGAANNDSVSPDNISIGDQASKVGNAARNIAIGHRSLVANVNGADNVALGVSAGKVVVGTAGGPGTGENNVFLGNYAGEDVITGRNSIYIGYKATSDGTDRDGEIVIGQTTTGNGANTATIACSSGFHVDGPMKPSDNIYMGDHKCIGISASHERILFASSGSIEVYGADFGINVDPTHRLHVVDSDSTSGEATGCIMKVDNGAANSAHAKGILVKCGNDTTSARALVVINNDDEYCGYINGNGDDQELRTVDGSDARLKENIQDSSLNGLNIINGLKMRQFDWKRNGNHVDIGVVAQEVLETYPKAVESSDEDSYGIMTQDFIYPLLKAVQELSAKVTALEAQIN